MLKKNKKKILFLFDEPVSPLDAKIKTNLGICA
jgi:ABC-type sugar transport system ATPase subunit